MGLAARKEVAQAFEHLLAVRVNQHSAVVIDQEGIPQPAEIQRVENSVDGFQLQIATHHPRQRAITADCAGNGDQQAITRISRQVRRGQADARTRLGRFVPGALAWIIAGRQVTGGVLGIGAVRFTEVGV